MMPQDDAYGTWAGQSGNICSITELIEFVYPELQKIATALLANERPGHTLQPTAVVHEAYLRLAGQCGVQWISPAHFKAVAALAMRRVLCDHAKSKKRKKRGGDQERVTLKDEYGLTNTRSRLDQLAVDQALTQLASRDPLTGSVVELRFYGGLEIKEVAQVLGISPRKVDERWAWGRKWLGRLLRD